MDITTDHRHQLLTTQQQLSPNQHCLTIYQPCQDRSLRQLSLSLKSAILEQCKDYQPVASNKQLRHYLVDSVMAKIGEWRELHQGVALFAVLDSNHNNASTTTKISQLHNLNQAPIKTEFLGKVFNLDQLSYWLNHPQLCLVLDLQSHTAKLFGWNGNKLIALTQLDNPFIDKTKDEYLEKHSPLPHKQAFYSTGADKTDQKRQEELELFGSTVTEFILDNYESSQINYLIAFYSTRYSDYSSQLHRDLTQNDPGYQVIMIDKNLQKKDELLSKLSQTLNRLDQKHRRQQLSSAQNKPELFKKSWKGLTNASRNNSIETLFIQPPIKRQGYLRPPNLLYSHPVKNSSLINNIYPHLVSQVVQADGRIELLPTQSQLKIAAKLRFKL